MLTVFETHPIQYHAPVYRAVQQLGVPVTVIYASDFSVSGYRDKEFGEQFAWDTDLLSGTTPIFLSRVNDGGPRSVEEIKPDRSAMRSALVKSGARAALICGYGFAFHRAAFSVARSTGLPLLFRAEATDLGARRGWMKGLIRDAYLRWFYDRFAAVLYIGASARAHFQRLGVQEQKLFFSPYCVNTTPFAAPDERFREGRGPQDIVICFSGKLMPRKCPDLLVRACKRLPPDLRRRILVSFIGSGEMQDMLLRLAAEEPSIRTRFVGFQNQSQIGRHYDAADVLALPSLYEPWGLVVNEAFHHGLPAVVSDTVACAADLVEPGTTGEIFTAGSEEGLAAALERVVNLVGRPDVAVRCRAKVDGYSIEKAAEGLVRAYRSVTS